MLRLLLAMTMGLAACKKSASDAAVQGAGESIGRWKKTWELIVSSPTDEGTKSEDACNDFVATAKGDLFAVGFGTALVSKDSQRDVVIRRVAADGKELLESWPEVFDAAKGNDSAQTVAVDAQGSLYVGGSARNYESAESALDGWIRKFAPSGQEDVFNWDKKIADDRLVGGFETVEDIVTSATSVYAAGHYNSSGWLKRYSLAGEEASDWHVEETTRPSRADAVALDTKGNVYLAGFSRNGAQPFVWLKKYLPTGKEDVAGWNKKLTVDIVEGTVSPRLAVDGADNIFLAVTGHNLVSATSGLDWWLKKYNPDGSDNGAFDEKIDGGADDDVQGLFVDTAGNVVIAGSGVSIVSPESGKDLWVRFFDQSGIESKADEIRIDGGASAGANAVGVVSGNLIVCGYGTNLKDPASATDFWLMRFSR